MIHINSLSGQTTKRIAYIVALAVFIINLTLAMQATSMLPIVDGWAVLNRIMHYNFGELSWDQYLFRPHGAHLHFIVYAVAWLDYHFFDGQQKLMQAVSLGATALFCLIIVTLIIRQGLRSIAVVRRHAGGVPLKWQVTSGLAMVSMAQIQNKQATGVNLFIPIIDGLLQFHVTLETATTRGNGGLS